MLLLYNLSDAVRLLLFYVEVIHVLFIPSKELGELCELIIEFTVFAYCLIEEDANILLN